MSKNNASEKEQQVRVLTFSVEEGAYCMSEYEIPASVFKKSAVKVSRTEPDIFAILVNNLTKKAREILGI